MAYGDITKLLAIVNFFVDRLEQSGNEVHLWLKREHEIYQCSSCGQATFVSYENWDVSVVDLPVWGKRTILHFRKHRIRCPCNNELRVEKLAWLYAGARVTMRLAYAVHAWCRHATVLDVAEGYGLDWHTVKEIDRWFLELAVAVADRRNLRRISIDELSYQKRHKYLTIVTDIDGRRVIWVGKHRRRRTLYRFAKQIGRKAAREIEVVAIDMWRPYRAAILQKFPNATVVCNKFHVMKHLNEAVDQVRKDESRRLRKTGRTVLKNKRWLLLKGQEKLSPEQQQDLQALCEQNASLEKAYVLKEQFREIYRRRCQPGEQLLEFVGDTRRLIDGWIQRAMESGLLPLKRFVEMIRRWKEGVIAYFREQVTTSLSEGLGNKIRTVMKRSYGYRDFDYQILKIYQAGRLI